MRSMQSAALTGGVLLAAAAIPIPIPSAEAGPAETITVRTENFARPPYSGATYYVYEQAGRTVCTKLSVCNKFDQCDVTYKPGAYKDPEDVAAGEPFATTPAVAIAPASRSKHLCLTRFGLVGRP